MVLPEGVLDQNGPKWSRRPFWPYQTTILTLPLDGGNSALVIGSESRPICRPQKHYFSRHFGASKKIASTKARLLKHDFPFHGYRHPPPPRKYYENSSPRVVFGVIFWVRLRQNYVITKPLTHQELFCVITGCRDLTLFHVELREIYVTPEKQILRVNSFVA